MIAKIAGFHSCVVACVPLCAIAGCQRFADTSSHEVSQLVSATTLGDDTGTLRERVRRTDQALGITVQPVGDHGQFEAFIIAGPTTFSARNLIGVVLTRGEQIVGIGLRTADGVHTFRPGTPPDRVSPEYVEEWRAVFGAGPKPTARRDFQAFKTDLCVIQLAIRFADVCHST